VRAGLPRPDDGEVVAGRSVSPRLGRVNATRPKVLAAAAALLAVPALSSCGVNFDAQTDQVYTPSDGENSYEGDVDVLNALIVSDSPGSGRFIATLVNNETSEPDALQGVQGVGESAEVTFSVEGGETEIAPGGSLSLALDESAMVAASGSEEVLAPGLYVRVSVSFANGESSELNVPVMAPGETYQEVELP
jgi:hypothetical protein